MTDNQRFSRAERHEKRRNSKRKFLFFASLAVVFCIILFSLIVFGNRETPQSSETVSGDTDELETKIEINESESEDPINNIDLGDHVEAIEEEDKVEIEEVESDDSNVLKAYSGDWKPIGTNQEGPHTTNYNEGSDDRKEIKKSISKVTGINEDNMIEHWIGNGGAQKVIATVQDKRNSEFYRVYLEWVDSKGWKPTKVDKIRNFNSANTGEEKEGNDEG